MSSNVDLKQVLPISLKNEFWEDFMDVVSDEFNLYNTELIDPKKIYFNVREQNEENQLLEISNTFGYIPNRSLNTSLEFLKQEIKSIVLRIKNKSTYTIYNYIFNTIPYLGYVYNLFWDNIKLTRQFDFTEVLLALGTHDFTLPFVKFLPILYFLDNISEILALDEGHILDETPLWYLDQSVIKNPTKHLAIEFCINQIIIKDSIEYLMIKEYLDYIYDNSEHTRKVIEVPHIGSQISILMDESGYFDNISNNDYSVPAIKLKSSVTPNFLKKIIIGDPLYLDNGTDLDLDKTPIFHLDNQYTYSGESINIYKAFKKLVAGIGSKGMPKKLYPVLDDYDYIIGYWCMDEERSDNIIIDSGLNNNNGIVNGTFERKQGIIGRGIQLNGIDSYISISNVIINNIDTTIIFWVRGLDDNQNFNIITLFKLGNFIVINYNKLTNILTCTLTIGINIVVLQGTYILDNTDSNFIINLDRINNLATLKINNIILDSKDISIITNFAGTYVINFGSDSSTNYFNGIIDELKIYSLLLTDNEETYYYDNKLGNINYLDNKIYEIELSNAEIYEDVNWYILNSYIIGNTMKGEIIDYGDGIAYNFNGNFKNLNVIPGSIKIFYYFENSQLVIIDDGLGKLTGYGATGTFDYLTSYYNINFYKDYHIDNEILYQGSVTHLEVNTIKLNVLPNSFTINFFISSTQYSITDNGSGGIVGLGVLSGTIDYISGAIDITFTNPTDNTDIVCEYDYNLFTIPTNTLPIKVEYSVQEGLEITEAGIEDEDGLLSCYSTFPPVQLPNNKFHLSTQFVIRKT